MENKLEAEIKFNKIKRFEQFKSTFDTTIQLMGETEIIEYNPKHLKFKSILGNQNNIDNDSLFISSGYIKYKDLIIEAYTTIKDDHPYVYFISTKKRKEIKQFISFVNFFETIITINSHKISIIPDIKYYPDIKKELSEIH